MEVSTLIATHVLTAVVSATTAIVTNRVDLRWLRRSIGSLRHDIRDMQQDWKDLPIRFVPRQEVELILKSIDSNTRFTVDMVQALIHAGPRIKNIEAAGETRSFAQITIEGVDGHGGLNRWEGRVPFLYLDNRHIDGKAAPLVTCGCGCALDLDEALTLPWEIVGRPATLIEIAADFAAIKSAPFGLVAARYAQFTRIRLSNQAIEEFVRKRFTVFIAGLRHIFPAFDSFPATVQAGCLDLIYGLGITGFQEQYKHLIAAGCAVPPDFQRMAAECASNQGKPGNYDERNQARAELFLHPELA